MAQQKHNMVSERTEEERILTQAAGSKSSENKGVQGSSLSNKRKCFACNETSHTLDQCSIKGRLVTGAQLFAHSTRQPFYMIQPSEETVEKEKLYRHCLLITSDISNLDLSKVKVEVTKFWKLTNWEIRTEGRQNFRASFNSEDDLISCLKTPRIETSVDDKEVNFTVARWKEDDEENIELIREWFLVYGVPRIYRNWKELYQIVSAIGVLIDVDEESLLGDHKEPIKLKVALRSVDGAPFSCHFVFGWYSRCVTFMIEDKAQTTECERKVLEDCNGQDHLDEFGKEYRAKSDEAIEIPPEILNKGMNSESSTNDPLKHIDLHHAVFGARTVVGNHSDVAGAAQGAPQGPVQWQTIDVTQLTATYRPPAPSAAPPPSADRGKGKRPTTDSSGSGGSSKKSRSDSIGQALERLATLRMESMESRAREAAAAKATSVEACLQLVENDGHRIGGPVWYAACQLFHDPYHCFCFVRLPDAAMRLEYIFTCGKGADSSSGATQ